MNKIIARKSNANQENIVFLGFETDTLGFMTQVVAWKRHEKGADEALKLIKDKKLKGKFVNGDFVFDNAGMEIEVQ